MIPLYTVKEFIFPAKEHYVLHDSIPKRIKKFPAELKDTLDLSDIKYFLLFPNNTNGFLYLCYRLTIAKLIVSKL